VNITHFLSCGIVKGYCWCFLTVNFVLRSFMVFTGYLLFLAIECIAFHSSCLDFSVMGNVIILCI